MTTTTLRRPTAGQVRVSVDAVGTMIAGTVTDVGLSADGFVRGDRVAFSPALADDPVIDVDTLIGIPKNVSDRQAADLLAPGLLARAMITQVHPFARGQRVAVEVGNSTLRQVVSAWVSALGGDLVDDAGEADVVYSEQHRRLAAVEASHRQGRIQQAATEVFQAIRAGVFDDVQVARRDSERDAA
jgi:NADPH:quinone reductase